MTNYALLDDYQRFTDTVAVYPREHGLAYTALGLGDESAELYDVVTQYVHHLRISKKEAILAECGDVLWYVAQLMKWVIEEDGFNWVHFSDLDRVAMKTVDYEATLMGAAGRVVIHAGFIAGRVKKHMRGDGKLQSEVIKQSLCHVLAGVEDIARFCNSNLVLVSTENRRKLESRQERGVLKGDGGDR